MLDRNSTDLNSGKENAISLFTSTGTDFKDWITAYGIMVDFDELSRARKFLNSLPTASTEESNFLVVQNINLDYLENPPLYELSTGDRNILYSIGVSNGAFNGYARSLYEVLTGERIETDFPLDWRSTHENIDSPKQPIFKVFPNPIEDNYISLSIERADDNVTYYTIITDLFGKLYHKREINGDGIYEIDGSKFVPGIYFIAINDNYHKRVFEDKIIVIK